LQEGRFVLAKREKKNEHHFCNYERKEVETLPMLWYDLQKKQNKEEAASPLC